MNIPWEAIAASTALFVAGSGVACASDDSATPGPSGEVEAEPPLVRVSGEWTIAPLAIDNADFGAVPTEGDTDRGLVWAESWARLAVESDLGRRATWLLRGTALGTWGEDPYGLENESALVLETAQLAMRIHEEPGLTLVVGRQNFRVGDGFFLDDGRADDRAAAWNIPLRSWDGARLDWRLDRFAATSAVFRLAHDFDETDAVIGGIHATWCPDAEATWEAHSVTADEDMPPTFVGAGFFAREDDTAESIDARLVFVRGGAPIGPIALAGEVGIQIGSAGGADLRGSSFHVDASFDLPLGGSSYVLVSRLRASGDDGSTEESEAFFPWNFGARDWSLYYLGEIAGSMLLGNSDQRVWKVETGFQPIAGAWLRAYGLRADADEGAWFELPEGSSRRIADEVDVAFDWAPEDAEWKIWALAGAARRREAAARGESGDATASLLSLGLTRMF